ncbi:DUF3710 domain-containing protein [Antribacter gilvus]|uniref:DUF3710 domain-containing protein n=1 Tax=Antribacter gilvus TaxID=2304675 RepID=UPI000F775277|nr:DUF3710 domain-containing protein [Antribacter gilvus]
MGLFRRSAANEPAQDEAAESESRPAWDSVASERERPAQGPFDRSQVDQTGPRVDLGAIWLPVLPGLELRMEIDKKTQKVTGVTAALAGSTLQVQAFAAPRTDGIWDEIRAELATSVAQQGGTVDDVPGVFGRELLVRLPATDQEGKPAVRPARFVGVDGPRWFLRGVLSGKAALDHEAARQLESVFANIVVVRDQSPRPPRDLLTLTLPKAPGQRGEAGAPAATAGLEGVTPQVPFDPLKRGPEITEIR